MERAIRKEGRWEGERRELIVMKASQTGKGGRVWLQTL